MATAKAQGSKVVTRVRSGKDGKGVSSVTEYYLASASSSGVTTSTSGWTTSIQTITEAKPYLWNYEKVVYSDGSSTTTTPVIIGHYGADGRGITSVTEYYLASASSSDVTTSTSGWTTTPQAVTSTLRYLWHFTRTTYSSGTTTVDTTPHIISVFADTGLTYRYSKFVSGVEYRNDNNPYYRDANNIGYIDVVYSDEITIYSATNPPSAWICAKTNTGQALPVSGASNTYWTSMNSFKPIYTALVLANRIKAKYLDVDDLAANDAFISALTVNKLTVKNGNSIIAKIGDMENYTVDGVSGKYPFWMGGATPADAVTRIDSTGKLTTANIVAKGGKIGNFSINSGLWLTASGDGYSMGFSAAAFDLQSNSIGITPEDTSYNKRSLTQSSHIHFAGYEDTYHSFSERLLAYMYARVNNPNNYPIQYRNVALEVEASGSIKYSINPTSGYQRKGNFSIVSLGGKFLGWRPEIRAINSDATLYPADCVVVVSDDCTITFPTSPEDGQTYFIFIMAKYNITLNFGSKKCWRNGEGYGNTQTHSSLNSGIDIITYSAIRDEWIMHCANAA